MTPGSLRLTLFFPAAILILLISFAGCSTGTGKLSYETRIDDFKSLIRNFEDPPSEFRSAPFWIWHEKVCKEKIREQLVDFREKGFGGVFVHPRYGMITEYLSEEWFEMVEYTLSVARELGLYVWIYDENSYPSGFAGGHVPHDMPDSYRYGQALRIHRTNRFEPDPDLRYLHYFEVNGQGEAVEFHDPAARTGNRGEFILLELVNYPQNKWHAGWSYVDLLYPGVTEKFMEITMQGYEDRFGGHFGNLIPGVFTDEPNIAPPGGRTAVRWTPDLYDEFEKRWGYRLQDNLLSLFEETGNWKKVRHNYFQLLLQMFIDRWSKPWFEYTESRNLKWTGHYWEHGWPSPHHGGDNMAMYAWHQVPGVDLLFNRMYTEERPTQFGNVRNVKELRSAANQTGRIRTLSETYGGAGWELTFEDMKRLGDWMYVLGVNFLNQHMAYMTLLGDRKHDFPQSISYHAPWWEHYGHQLDYFARLSVAMSAGRQNNNILVIEPTTTTWMYYSSYRPNAYLNEIGNNFNDLLDRMEQYKIGYDLGSENIIKDRGSVENGRFIVGEADYEVVVLPFGMENIDRPTFELLSRFLESGGRVVSLKTLPSMIAGSLSDEPMKLMREHNGRWLHASCFTDPHVYLHFDNKRLQFSQSAMKSKWFLHHERELDDGRLVFLVNSSPDEDMEGYFITSGEMVARLDPETGRVTGWPHTGDNGQIRVGFSVKPAGSLLLFIPDRKIAVDYQAERPAATIVMESSEMQIRPLSPNVVTLDYGELSIEGQSLGRLYFYSAADRVWQHYGYNDNPWVSSSQFRTELVDADTFSTATGFEFVYDFIVRQGTDMRSVTAVAERPGIFSLTVNGRTLEPVPGRWFVEKDFAVYAVGEYLSPGQNRISLRASPMSMFAELQPVYLTGFFSLAEAGAGWEIIPQQPLRAGSWRKSGYPFYSDRVSYIKNVWIEKVPQRVMVQLGEWNGTVAEVLVNNRPAAIIQSPPYEADITGLVGEGENSIEVTVYGSLKNLLGPHHNVTRRGIVTPWSFKYAPQVQPPGSGYDLLDYGLMEGFRVMVSDR
jgi:hypothetical protein